jgi:hypothetical protein
VLGDAGEPRVRARSRKVGGPTRQDRQRHSRHYRPVPPAQSLPRRNSRLFHEFLTILIGFVTNFFKNIEKAY